MSEAQEVHAYDQVMAQVAELHPGHTKVWYEQYILRMSHYIENKGDMTGAPELPDE